MYDNFSQTFIDVANKHAPLKQKKVLNKPAPFMNKLLKQAIFKKRMLLNKYNACKSSKNWENYRKQRNLATNIKRKSINKYFIDRCVGGCKSGNFWPTVKPFLTNKGNTHKKDTILSENNHLVTNQQEVLYVIFLITFL